MKPVNRRTARKNASPLNGLHHEDSEEIHACCRTFRVAVSVKEVL